ncbi:MAG TPA: LysR family transcriptional regulator [Candidatus Blautia faecipullorum]|nr:LysR family transcriptional regulator [Candidatus Blautia faecipullorum]
MTIRHLKIFIAVAETGSMSAAANSLYLTQPTVSQAVRDLEAHYQVPLFERLHKKLFITEEGRQLLELARMAVGNFDSLELSMQRFQEKLTLRVGSSLTVGTCLMSSVISDLEAACPKMDIYSFVSNTAEIEQKLLRRELDAAVVEGAIESPKLAAIPIVEDSLVLVCGKNHEFYEKDMIRSSELEGRKFAMREKGSGTRKLFEQYLSAHNIHIQTAWEANCPRTILNAVIHNNALAVMSQRLLKHEILHRSVKIFHYETGEWNRFFKLVYLKKNTEGPVSSGESPENRYPLPCIGELRSVLENYRALTRPREFPACILKDDTPV